MRDDSASGSLKDGVHPKIQLAKLKSLASTGNEEKVKNQNEAESDVANQTPKSNNQVPQLDVKADESNHADKEKEEEKKSK